jgi:hypothetical protein
VASVYYRRVLGRDQFRIDRGSMMSLRLGLIGAFALAVIVAVAAMDMTRPAAAQGGAVCTYGSASYRACCKQSYARHPRMGARARADDIDACMNKGSSGKKKKKKQSG